MEAGETLEECARREAEEELGVVVGDLRFLCVSNIIAYGKHYVDIEFLGDIGNQVPRLAEPEGFSEFDWFPLDSLPNPPFRSGALCPGQLPQRPVLLSGGLTVGGWFIGSRLWRFSRLLR